MNKKKVLIAVGDKSYSTILKNNFDSYPDSFSLSSQEVLHRRFLEEILDLEKPDILVIHDQYLGSDFIRPEQQDQELTSLIRKFRVNYDDSLRIIFLCERPKGDPLLSTIVSIGVRDIFNTNSFDVVDFIEQILEKPRFSNVEKFLLPASPLIPFVEEEGDEDEMERDEDSAEGESKSKNPIIQNVIEKKVIQKVVEKKVVQKVVNKNVIKRNYQVQITNHTEKIVGIPVKKKLIMIGSPNHRSGSTFISHLLARALTQMGVTVTYVESPFSKAYTFDRFTGQQFADDYRSKFYQFSKYIDPKLRSVFEWTIEDIDIICKHPTNEPVYAGEEVSFDNLIKVLFSSQATVTIMDVGTDWEYELFQDVFDIADHAYFIIEPDIPSIQYLEESKKESVQFLLKQMENEKTLLIGNHFEKRMLSNQLIKALYSEKMVTHFPTFSTADVFQAQYDGVFLNDYKDYQKRIEPYVEPLLKQILPQEFIKKHKKGSGLFKGIFNKKITVEKTDFKGEEMKA